MIAKIKFCFCCFILISLKINAQDNPPLIGFDIKSSNSGPSYVTDIAKDASGNIYVAGVFGGTMEAYSLTSAGSNDIFFAKFNSAGSLLWIKRIGSTGDDQALTISFDQTGSTIFLGGIFSGTVDFDPNGGTASLTSGGGRDAFLGRYTTDGAYMWIGNISGTADAQIRDIVCTPTTVYVTGLFYGTADFGFGSDFNSQTSSGVADAFIAGYFMSSGTLNNLRIIGSTAGEDYGYSIATDASSNIYVTGVYNGTVNFGNTNLSSTGNMDMFCAKYTSTLSPVWAASSGVNATNDFGKAITVDGSGNVYITGSWYTGVWIQKFNSSGVSQWSTSLCQFGGGVGQGEGITVNTNGDVVVAGYFTSSTGFATVCSGPYYFSSLGDSDSFVAKYSGVDGSFKWVKTVLNTGPDAYNTITSDVANNVIVAGNGTTVSNYSLQITKYFDDPPSQPAALTFSNVTTSGFDASYTPTFSQPINGQGGFIIVRKTGSAPMEIPPDGISPESYFDFGGAEILGSSTVVGYSYTGSATSFNLSSAPPNTEYYYAIYAFNGYGNYLHANPLRGSQFTLATEPTAQPTGLTFNSFTQTSFIGSFSPAAGSPTGYLVLRKVASAPTGLPTDATTYSLGSVIGDGVVVSSGPSTTFAQSGLTAGTTYFYQVFSYNGSGQSLNYRTTSSLSNSTVTIPSNPIAISATGTTQTSFTANWNSSTSATSYRLDVSSDNFSTFVSGYNNRSVTGTSDPVTGLSPNTTYKYRVRAVNASGTSGNSNEISQNTVPATTVAIAATIPSQTGFTANWNAVAGATGYKLDVSDNAGFSSFVAGFSNKDVTSNNSPVTGLSSGITYYYRVRSYNSAGTSPNSNTISQITVPPNPVAGSATLPAQTQFTANWSAATGATSYRVDVSSDGFTSFVSGFNDRIVSGTIELVTGLNPGVTYQYRVRAVNTAGVSGNSNSITQLTVPASPAPSASEPGQTGFKINWTSVVGAVDYSVDLSQDNFATLFTGYPKSETATSHTVTGLTPGTIYQFRIRSRNTAGTSPSSSTVSQITVPANPVAMAYSTPTATSFIANWEVVNGADGYVIDVSLADDNFAPNLANYNAKQVPNFGDYQVTGLTPSTAYRYRVRAYNSAGVSGNSLSKLAVTTDASGGGTPTAPSITIVDNQNSQSSVKSSVSGGFGTISIIFKHRKITEANFTSEPPTNLVSTTYEATINSSFLDEIGMEYYFQVTDELDKTSESNKGYIYKTFASQSIPALGSGGTLSSYRIISVPLKLESNDIRDVFAPLLSLYGGYNKEKWRLLRYQNGRNTDYDGLSRIDQGKGYWFNSLEPVDIKLSGQSIPANQLAPFQMQLEKGWNQIGNPYLFDIDWDDVRAANSAADVDQDYLVYDPGNANVKTSNSIKTWSGGFVYANSAQTLNIPVTLKNTAGGRILSTELTRELDQPDWFVPITLVHAGSTNDYSGFGMHPEAMIDKDRFDTQTAPRFINYLELNSYHPEAFTPRFARDVVPTAKSYIWTYNVESNVEESIAKLEWNPSLFGNNSAQLFLYDAESNELIDMRKNSVYSFSINTSKIIKFIYSADEKSLQPESDAIGKAYPNPFTHSTTIPFFTSKVDGHVQIAVYDLMGKRIKDLVNNRFDPGYHETTWDGTDSQSSRVTQGIYLYQMISGDNRKIGRVIIR